MKAAFKSTRDLQSQLLQETYDYYVRDKNERGTDNFGSCTYIATSDYSGKNIYCAIGRLLNEKELEIFLDNSIGSIGTINLDYSFDQIFSWTLPVMPSRLLKYGLEFLVYLQNFHDMSTHWKDGQDLTKKGKQFYNYIIEEFDLTAKKLKV